MGNIVDFNKAKKDVEKKKIKQSSVKAKNQKLAQKQRRYDEGKRITPIRFYLGVIACIAAVYFVINLIK